MPGRFLKICRESSVRACLEMAFGRLPSQFALGFMLDVQTRVIFKINRKSVIIFGVTVGMVPQQRCFGRIGTWKEAIILVCMKLHQFTTFEHF